MFKLSLHHQGIISNPNEHIDCCNNNKTSINQRSNFAQDDKLKCIRIRSRRKIITGDDYRQDSAAEVMRDLNNWVLEVYAHSLGSFGNNNMYLSHDDWLVQGVALHELENCYTKEPEIFDERVPFSFQYKMLSSCNRYRRNAVYDDELLIIKKKI